MAQATTILKNSLIYIDSLSGNDIRSQDFKDLLSVLKEHGGVLNNASWISQFEDDLSEVSLYMPTLIRSSVEPNPDPQNEFNLIADAEWTNEVLCRLQMEVDEEVDEEGDEFWQCDFSGLDTMSLPILKRQTSIGNDVLDGDGYVENIVHLSNDLLPSHPIKLTRQTTSNCLKTGNYDVPTPVFPPKPSEDGSISLPILPRLTSIGHDQLIGCPENHEYPANPLERRSLRTTGVSNANFPPRSVSVQESTHVPWGGEDWDAYTKK